MFYAIKGGVLRMSSVTATSTASYISKHVLILTYIDQPIQIILKLTINIGFCLIKIGFRLMYGCPVCPRKNRYCYLFLSIGSCQRVNRLCLSSEFNPVPLARQPTFIVLS